MRRPKVINRTLYEHEIHTERPWYSKALGVWVPDPKAGKHFALTCSEIQEAIGVALEYGMPGNASMDAPGGRVVKFSWVDDKPWPT